ncbi:hydrogenase iron-sulfur subunit [Bacteroidota bacterium]
MTKLDKYTTNDFKPRIVGFVCNWGAYSGVEMAGVNKKEYPASINLLRLMCLGRLNLGLILKAFELGADGVMLLGCPTDDCHYECGGEKAREVFTQAKGVLSLLGIDQNKLAFIEVPLGREDLLLRQISTFVKRLDRPKPKSRRRKVKVASPV